MPKNATFENQLLSSVYVSDKMIERKIKVFALRCDLKETQFIFEHEQYEISDGVHIPAKGGGEKGISYLVFSLL